MNEADICLTTAGNKGISDLSNIIHAIKPTFKTPIAANLPFGLNMVAVIDVFGYKIVRNLNTNAVIKKDVYATFNHVHTLGFYANQLNMVTTTATIDTAKETLTYDGTLNFVTERLSFPFKSTYNYLNYNHGFTASVNFVAGSFDIQKFSKLFSNKGDILRLPFIQGMHSI